MFALAAPAVLANPLVVRAASTVRDLSVSRSTLAGVHAYMNTQTDVAMTSCKPMSVTIGCQESL